MKKTAGITTDNYKVAKFETELAAHLLTEYEVVKIKNSKISIIKVKCDENQVETIKHICQKVEAHFRSMRN